jgi:hypothetical protein
MGLLKLLLHAVQAPTYSEAVARVLGRPPPPGSVWIRHVGNTQAPNVQVTEFSFDGGARWMPYAQVDADSPARICFDHAMHDPVVAAKLWPDISSPMGIRLEVESAGPRDDGTSTQPPRAR